MISAGYTDLYFWVDENGVKHYTDTPPEEAVDAGKVKKTRTAEYAFSHGLYKVKEGVAYCGERTLGDALTNTYTERRALVDAYFKRKDALKRMKDLRTWSQESERDDLIGYYLAEINETECVIDWADHRVRDLDRVRVEILEEARVLREEFDKVAVPCGKPPVNAAPRDKELMEWKKCDRKNMDLPNDIYFRLREAETKKRTLERAMGEE